MNRKLDTAGVFERLFDVYKQQFTLIVPAAIIVFLPVALLNGAAIAGGGIGLLLVGLVLSTIASVWLQGMVIEAVRDAQDGRRDFTLGGLFRSVMPVLPMLFGVGLLAGLGIGVGFLLLIVPGLILLTWWSVVAPAVVIERRGLDAFGRSRDLVRGNGWQVFGVIVVVFVIQFLANNLLSAVFGGADSFVGALLASLISSALIGPLSAIAAALIYLELREVKGEGLPGAEGAGGERQVGPTDYVGEPGAAQPSPFGQPGSSASEAFGGSPESPPPPPSQNP
jgi:hypothetical protein